MVIDLNEWHRKFLEDMIDQEKRQSTITHYDHIISEFIKYASDFEEVTKSVVIDYKQLMCDKFGPTTVNNYLLIINKFLAYLGCPELRVKYLKIQKKASLEEVLEPIEFKRLLRTAKQYEQYDMYMIMKVLAYTGIRIEELKYFTFENIQSNYIQIFNKAKIRKVIVRNDLRRELLSYCKNNHIKSGYVFKSPKYEDRMIHTSTIFKRMKKLASLTPGIKKSKVHPHSFRHLFAIKFLDEGGEISELADILGHSKIDTTTIYTRSTDLMKKRKIEKIKY